VLFSALSQWHFVQGQLQAKLDHVNLSRHQATAEAELATVARTKPADAVVLFLDPMLRWSPDFVSSPHRPGPPRTFLGPGGLMEALGPDRTIPTLAPGRRLLFVQSLRFKEKNDPFDPEKLVRQDPELFAITRIVGEYSQFVWVEKLK
jgi:hypothetical protein